MFITYSLLPKIVKRILPFIFLINTLITVSNQPLVVRAAEAGNSPGSVPVITDFNYYANLCNLLRNQQKYEAALPVCQQAMNMRRRNPVLWAIRSDVLFNLGRYEEAAASAAAAIQMRSKYSYAQLQQCRALSELGNQDLAIAACDQALQINKDWGEMSPAVAWSTRGLALERGKQYTEALAAYEQAVKLQPQYSLALASQCRVLSEMGQYETAIAACDQAIQTNNNWGNSSLAQASFWRGLTFSRWGKYQQALSSCPQVTTSDESIEQKRMLACIKQKRLNRLQAAIDAFKRTVEINPKDATAWTYQGILLAELGQYSQAKIAYEAALKVSPNYSLALAGQCAILNKLENYQAALTACDSALQGDGNWDENGSLLAHLQRGQALAGLKQYEDALAAVEQALSHKSDFAQTWNAKSVILWQMNQYQEALQANDRAVAIAPNYFQAWLNRGSILKALNRKEEAIAAYERSLTSDVSLISDATLADVWTNRSSLLWDLGRYQEAVNSTNSAIELNPNSVTAWFNRAVFLDSLHQYEAAAIAYQEALKIEPKQERVWFALGVVLLRLKRDQEALTAFEEALKINPNYPEAKHNRDFLIRLHPTTGEASGE